jgi:hypothetical protein
VTQIINFVFGKLDCNSDGKLTIEDLNNFKKKNNLLESELSSLENKCTENEYNL